MRPCADPPATGWWSNLSASPETTLLEGVCRPEESTVVKDASYSLLKSPSETVHVTQHCFGFILAPPGGVGGKPKSSEQTSRLGRSSQQKITKPFTGGNIIHLTQKFHPVPPSSYYTIQCLFSVQVPALKTSCHVVPVKRSNQ